VLFVTVGGWERASTRCRVLQYLPRLGGEWDVYHCTLGVSSWAERRLRLWEQPSRTLRQRAVRRLHYHWYRWHERGDDAARMRASTRDAYDLVFLQKVVPPPAILARFNAGGGALVYDFDDALFASGGKRPSRDERLFRRRLEACLRSADLVITCSPFNSHYARQFAGRVEELLTPVDVGRYAPLARPSGDRPITIGWVGSPSTTPYLRWAIPVLREVAAARPQARFLLIGAEPFPLEGLPASFETWSYETELAHLSAFDIGIMPVRPSDWANGKAGYKLLQYMALGLPCVASPDGVNAEIIGNGVTGYLAADAAAWRERLIALIDDAALRARMGAAAREVAERRFSVDHLFPRWQGLLERAITVAQERRAAR
jgi:glycosyltransferase involved in cell wall biosynthesis